MLLRRSALRLINSPSAITFSQPRAYSSLTIPSFRASTKSTAINFQQRWASDDAQKKEDTPVSHLQATPQEEVENAIHTDNATAPKEQSSSTSAIASESQPENSEQPQSTLQAAAETISDVAGQATEAVQNFARRTSPLKSYGEVRKTHAEMTNTPKRTVYVGNLFFDVTENDLVKELTRFGAIKKAKLLRDARGLSKGFGYVEFETVDSATQAVENLNQQLFEGRRLMVQFAAYDSSMAETMPRTGMNQGPRNPPSKTLFIGNMSFEMTDRDLNNLFRGIRNVIDVRVAIDRRTGQPRGFAHADFIDVKSAIEAQKLLEGKEVYGRRLRIDYSFGPSNAPKNTPTE